MKEVYLYIIREAQGNPNFGKVLFNKILYFSDFDFYEKNERSITGGSYLKVEHGPMASTFELTIKYLKIMQLIKEITVKKNKYDQKRYVLLKEFYPEKLTKDEIRELDRNINRIGGMTASQASEYSHQDMPYKATKDGDQIDYNLVFYRNPIYSVQADTPS